MSRQLEDGVGELKNKKGVARHAALRLRAGLMSVPSLIVKNRVFVIFLSVLASKGSVCDGVVHNFLVKKIRNKKDKETKKLTT